MSITFTVTISNTYNSKEIEKALGHNLTQVRAFDATSIYSFQMNVVSYHVMNILQHLYDQHIVLAWTASNGYNSAIYLVHINY